MYMAVKLQLNFFRMLSLKTVVYSYGYKENFPHV